MSSEVVIDVQPGTTHQHVDVELTHMCMCERGCRKFNRCILNIPSDVKTGKCGTTPCDFCEFRVYCCSDESGIFLGILCFPITFPMKLLCQAPCIGYNMCRNKCNGTIGLEYIC
jgi:hypothetical protein